MTNRGKLSAALTAVAILLLGPLLSFLREPHPDQAWLLYLSERLLEGQRQGVDFIEVNPPLSIWLMLPPTLLSRLTPLSPGSSLVVLMTILCLGVLFLTARLLATVVESKSERVQLILVASLVGLVWPRMDFAGREHMALVLSIPFTVLAAVRTARRPVGPGYAWSAGVLGGLGFSLKPYFLVGWLLLESYLWVRLRRETFRRVELFVVVGWGVVYAGSVLLLVPDYLPMARELTLLYTEYLDNGFLYAAGLAGPLLLVPALALAFQADPRRVDVLRDVLGLAAVGYLLAAVLQRKGFTYHYLAAWGFTILLLIRAWQTRPPTLGWNASGVVARLGFLILLIWPLRVSADAIRELVRPEDLRYRFDPTYAEVVPRVRELAEGGPIAVFSANPAACWPLTLESGAQWSLRYMSLWPLAAFYHDQMRESPLQPVRPVPYASRSGFERRFSDQILEDLQTRSPSLLLVLLPAADPPVRRLDYLEYFGSDPRFEQFLAQYQEVLRIGHFALWLRVIRQPVSTGQLPGRTNRS